MDQMTLDGLGPEAAAEARDAALAWSRDGRLDRLWRRDGSLWTGSGEERWLGWLDAPERSRALLGQLDALADGARADGFSHAVVLGMGGSSLAPDVLARSFGPQPGRPRLLVLDSTVADQVRGLEDRIDLARTLFFVSSKSGSTSEPNLFLDYFHDRLRVAFGTASAGSRFVAVTDPGSSLEERARDLGFRQVLAGEPSVGGRYSALTAFGLGPAAAMGLDVRALLDRAAAMARACGPQAHGEDNPGLALGVALGLMARRGRDKLTLVTTPAIDSFGGWLEQLVAESTGKRGTGIVPVDGERPGAPDVYGADRLFVYLRLDGDDAEVTDRAVAALAAAGHPVLRIGLADLRDLGAEFFRWELATAVAGAELRLDPFDQPDVEAAKVATKRLSKAYETTGRLPGPEPFLERDGITFHGDVPEGGAAGNPAAALRGHLDRLGAGDYLAIQAFVAMDDDHRADLQEFRHRVRDRRRVATTLGYGPRFLHSTGQLHKGGPGSGVFLQITGPSRAEAPIPGRPYGFDLVAAAQAAGDFEVLAERGRRVLRVHLGGGVAEGLARLRGWVEASA